MKKIFIILLTVMLSLKSFCQIDQIVSDSITARIDSLSATLATAVVKLNTTINGTTIAIDTLTIPLNSIYCYNIICLAKDTATLGWGWCELRVVVVNNNGVYSIPKVVTYSAYGTSIGGTLFSVSMSGLYAVMKIKGTTGHTINWYVSKEVIAKL